jgi:hypothetical protein
VFLYGRVRDWSLPRILLVAIGIGVAEESVKHFLPHRDFDLPVIAMDAVGVCLASMFWHGVERLMGKG